LLTVLIVDTEILNFLAIEDRLSPGWTIYINLTSDGSILLISRSVR
jgi:hypothetical protein